MHQAERGRLLARVTDEGGESNKRDRIPREASRPDVDKWAGRFSNCPSGNARGIACTARPAAGCVGGDLGVGVCFGLI